MSEHPNAALARSAWDAVAMSDVEALRKIFADDIVWHVMGDSPWAGERNGYDSILDYLAEVGESGDSYDASLEDLLVSNDRVALLCHVSSKRKGRSLDVGYLLMGRVVGGVFAEMWTLPLDPEAVRRFWAGG